MNIVLGVCGFGLGHSVRERPVLEGLLARGHQVMLVTNDQSHDFFTRHFPDVPNLRVYVPLIHTTPQGLDYQATADDPRNAQGEEQRAFWTACAEVERRFGRPDLVISDYDMVSAQLAYLFDVPLVTLDQQSKFLGYECPSFGDFTPGEHRRRLGYFFPKVARRVATSFFAVDYPSVPRFPVTVIPPILGRDVAGLLPVPEPGRVTVYLSAASSIAQPLEELVDVFAGLPEHHFTCFVDADPTRLPANVSIRPVSRPAFVDSLSRSEAVVATAGHNLITEALYLQVPMFLVPFHHYEQQLNARVISESGAGRAAETVTRAELRELLENLDDYRRRSRESQRLFTTFDGDTVFLDTVEAMLYEGIRA
jgi:uncharacterized protein (TIGR00661 family)